MTKYTVTVTIEDKEIYPRGCAPELIQQKLVGMINAGLRRTSLPDNNPLHIDQFTIDINSQGSTLDSGNAKIDKFLREIVSAHHTNARHYAHEIENIPLPLKVTDEEPREGEVYEAARPYLMVVGVSSDDIVRGIIPSYWYRFGVPYFWNIPNATEEQKKIYDGVVRGYGWRDLYGNIYENAFNGFGTPWEDVVIGYFDVPDELLPYLHSNLFMYPWKGEVVDGD